ncbi:cryptochrome/photolyase family protein [Chitinasiproducens palmae]|uniref:Deoxyribodipyrimidine photo-lyase n=1 Tax=Chitinasiproducens palmae TaxID=1770053 RepID=A0A1H2PNU1_9BURK|nr:deoxyribodipyrimidine photo-lyase [Chitinasiproducens palmae]SDV47854.1 deoxyribodipyrimidine photo-lyase [Chitinasiproducens palmae]
MTDFNRALVWFRRDLRISDHAALYHALSRAREVCAVFVFDTDILAGLPSDDRRVAFIHESVAALDAELRAAGSALHVVHGRAIDLIPQVARACDAQAVFVNGDVEPAAVARDEAVAETLAEADIAYHAFEDRSIVAPAALLNKAGKPYTVFTPYKRAWLARAVPDELGAFETVPLLERMASRERLPLLRDSRVPTLASLGFGAAQSPTEGGSDAAVAQLDAFLERIARYHRDRDTPAIDAQSGLGIHLRHGTLSPRAAARAAYAASLHARERDGAETWLSELAWRDFFAQILHHHPRLVQHRHRASFKPAYDRIVWADGKEADRHFRAWCEGRTGYPIVDAGMRQLVQSGFMHNRLRMITASFLCKDLGIDWRRGESFFERHLNDFELSSNNGNWQWAASSGCDAQPWFRIFNPVEQSRRFDANGDFIRKWVPELAPLPASALHAPWQAAATLLAEAGITIGDDASHTYPGPIVDHREAREATLQRYDVVREARLTGQPGAVGRGKRGGDGWSDGHDGHDGNDGNDGDDSEDAGAGTGEGDDQAA